MLAYEHRQYKREEQVVNAFFRLTLFGEGHGDPNGFFANLICMIQQHLVGKEIRPKEFVAKLQTLEDITAEYFIYTLLHGFRKFARSDTELNCMFALLVTKMSDFAAKTLDHKLLMECQANPQRMLEVNSINDDIAMSLDKPSE